MVLWLAKARSVFIKITIYTENHTNLERFKIVKLIKKNPD